VGPGRRARNGSAAGCRCSTCQPSPWRSPSIR
jgi:hypothetical protein